MIRSVTSDAAERAVRQAHAAVAGDDVDVRRFACVGACR